MTAATRKMQHVIYTVYVYSYSIEYGSLSVMFDKEGWRQQGKYRASQRDGQISPFDYNGAGRTGIVETFRPDDLRSKYDRRKIKIPLWKRPDHSTNYQAFGNRQQNETRDDCARSVPDYRYHLFGRRFCRFSMGWNEIWLFLLVIIIGRSS